MNSWMAMLVALIVAGCTGPGVTLSGGGTRVGLHRLDEIGARRYYAMSCAAGDLSDCERAAAQVCPGGTRVMEHGVRIGRAQGRRLPIREMVITCR